jgi:hypothetical protein
MLHLIFSMGAVKTLAGVATCGEGGGVAASSYELDAARSIQSKFFFIFWTHTMTFLQGDCLKQNNS